MAHIDPDGGPCFDSLRLSPRDQAQLLADLSRTSSNPSAGNNRRTGDRHQYILEAGLIVRMHHPGGSTVNYLVRARNLSTDGLGFLHGSFLHKGTRCVVGLKTVNQKPTRIDGKVVRCQHVRGHIHDIGVRFDAKIQMSDFVGGAVNLDPAAETSTELPALRGKILYVEDSISDQELLKFHLDSVGIEVERVSNGADALTAAERTKFDAVITGVWLPGMSGPEFAECLRKNGYKGAIIALTSIVLHFVFAVALPPPLPTERLVNFLLFPLVLWNFFAFTYVYRHAKLRSVPAFSFAATFVIIVDFIMARLLH